MCIYISLARREGSKYYVQYTSQTKKRKKKIRYTRSCGIEEGWLERDITPAAGTAAGIIIIVSLHSTALLTQRHK